MKYVSWIIESIWMYVKMWFSVNLYQDETWSKSKPKAYDGRRIDEYVPWQKQEIWYVGYHYNMRLEDAAKGIDLMQHLDELPNKKSQLKSYPDVSILNIDKWPKYVLYYIL